MRALTRRIILIKHFHSSLIHDPRFTLNHENSRLYRSPWAYLWWAVMTSHKKETWAKVRAMSVSSMGDKLRRRRHRAKQRLLWDGRYKPHYIILSLDDIDPDKHIDEKEYTRRWRGYIDGIEVLAHTWRELVRSRNLNKQRSLNIMWASRLLISPHVGIIAGLN